MLDWIKTQLAPPVFEGDEEKTRAARALHTLLLLVMLFLILLGGIATPFVFVEKLYNLGIALLLLLALMATLWQMRRGRVRLAGLMFVSMGWLGFTVFLLFAGGMTSIAAVFYVAITVVAGLLLGSRAAFLSALACILAGLGMVLLEVTGNLPQRIFPIPALVGWFDMALALLLTTMVLSLVLRSLNEVLVLARQQVAERQHAEEALRGEKEFTDAALDAQLDTFFLFEPATGQVRRWNRAFREISGYTDEEIAAQPAPASYYSPEDLERAAAFTETVLQEGTGTIELELICKDGRRVPTEYRVAVVHDDRGEPKYILSIGRDITERQRAERLLHTLNEAALAMERALTHEQIYTTISDEFRKLGFSCVVFVIDASKTRLLPIYYNYDAHGVDAAEKLLGLEAQELAIPIEAASVFIEAIRERKPALVAGDDVVRQVLPQPLKEFAEQVVEILQVPKSIVAPLIVEEEVTGLLVVQSDDLIAEDVPAITAFAHQMAAAWHKTALLHDLAANLEELKQTQAQFLQAQKMEAVGRLAGGVAHDFNNLLTTILGYTDLLLKDAASGDSTHADLEQIKRAAERATALTQQLLAFSRRQVLQPTVVDLNAVVADMQKMLRHWIGEDIELVTFLRPEIGRVQADPGQIEQVIMNLVINARDAMPSGGRLTIETANLDLDETYAHQHADTPPGRCVMLAISDTGIGMDERTQSHLFEPFFTTKEQGKGTGLGLSTVYGIVKQSGGSIYVYSEPSRGTTFKVYLPRIDQVADVRMPSAAPAPLLRGSETVLLVEDEDMVRYLAERVLARSGYAVLAARDADEAILVSEQHRAPIHLMVTDVVLPGGMGGPDLAAHLKTRRPEMQVLYVSGYTDNAIVHHSVLDPGVAFLQKPFTPEALARRVRDVLDARVSGNG